jgi:hypothetical protein
MANPNRVFARMAKSPFCTVREFNTHDEAEACAVERKAAGKEVRITPISNKFQNRRTWRVMEREKKSK